MIFQVSQSDAVIQGEAFTVPTRSAANTELCLKKSLGIAETKSGRGPVGE